MLHIKGLVYIKSLEKCGVNGMKNNNRKVISYLARKEYHADRGRRVVLTGAVAFAVMMLFCVFSFASGKLQTDMLRSARQRGAVSDTMLERATQEQYEQIQELSYIKDIGRHIQFGYALGDRAVVIDDVAWKKIKSPAFTDIHGAYPKEKMEIMLPIRTLKMMEISNPQIGMELPVTIAFSEEKQQEYTFHLSGYYTEYIATAQYGPPDAYFSQKFLDSISYGEEWDVTLYMRQDDRISGRKVEQNLYRDIAVRDVSQQFLGTDTSMEVAMFTMAGGFDTVYMLAVIILVSAGLLIYNVQHITFERRVREYGLLKTLGTTRKQLRAIVFLQTARHVVEGSMLGAATGLLIAVIVLPILLSRMYLYRIGSAARMITFHPLFLVLSVIFVCCVTFLSSALAIRHTLNLAPIEAVNYMEAAAGETYGGKSVLRKSVCLAAHGKSGRRFHLWRMAWRNIMRFKRRFLVSAVCLTLGLLVSLGVVMLSKGSDTTNQIEHEYFDISVSSRVENFNYNWIALQSHRLDEDGVLPLFPDELLDKIQSLPEIQESVVRQGAFGEFLLDEEALAIFMSEYDNFAGWPYRAVFGVVKLSEAELTQIKALSDEYGLGLDVDAVMEGKGMILIHDHTLSPAQIELGKKDIGKTFGVYDIANKKKTYDMQFCGYLDFEQEGIPDFARRAIDNTDIPFLISEKGFENIKAKEQNFSIYITAKEGARAALADKIRMLVDEFNAPLVSANKSS